MAELVDAPICYAKRMPKTKYTKEKLAPLVASSHSVMEVVRKLGLQEVGGNHAHIKKMIDNAGLDTSHFTGRAWNKGKTFHWLPLEVYLNNERKITSHRLRIRLIREGYKEKKCEKCGRRKWLGKPISLELDHINENHFDNRLENLQILCPNCHAQKTQSVH